MPWVPIHESGLSYSFYTYGTPTLVGSTVSYLRDEDGDGGSSQSDWALVFDTPIAGPIRVTAETYIAGTDRQGSSYVPGYLAVYNDAYFEESYVYNEAAPYPSDYYPDDDGVTAWAPNPTELSLPVPIAVLAYDPTRTGHDQVPDDRAFAFLIEVWQGDGPPSGGECFWTDLLGVAEDCGDGPSPVGDAVAVWPWDAWLWDHVLWNPDVAPVVLPELPERQTRTFALGDLLDGYGDVIDSCNNVLSGVKFDGSRMYTDPLEQGRNGCTGPSYRVSVALTPKDDVLRTMHAQDGGAFYPDLQIGYGHGVAAKAYVNVTGEFRLFGVTSIVGVYASLVEAGTSLSGSVPVFVGTPTGAWTPFDEASVEWPDLFYEGQNHEVMFGFNGVASYPAATFALDMEIEVVAERQARVVAKIVNLQGWDEDPDMEGFGLPEEPGDPLPGVIYIAEDILFESGGYIMSSVNEPVYYYGLVVGDLITVDPYTGEELENHGKMKVRFSAGG